MLIRTGAIFLLLAPIAGLALFERRLDQSAPR